MIVRRRFLGALALAVPLRALAQQPRQSRIGWLSAISAEDAAERLDSFRSSMRRHGYKEGGDYVLELRWADGRYEKLPALASELVQLKVDVLIAQSTLATKFAQQATATIPIVMSVAGDPVANGLVASLSKPSGNVTGVTSISADVSGKWLELVREALPRARRVAHLVNTDTSKAAVGAMHRAAKLLGMNLQSLGSGIPT